MRKERTDWRGSGLEKQANHLVFLDESSVNIDLTRRSLHKGDIVVMDNMRSHHVKEVAETLHAAGIELRYLPPYSNFNIV